MTAGAFAALVQARPAGRGRWRAHCPAHQPDHSPSLAIKEGSDGRTLVHCWAGCETDAVVASVGLTMRDLFPNEPFDLQAVAQDRRERLERNTAERTRAGTERKLADYVRRGHFAVMALGARLARTHDDAPEGDALATLFHEACSLLRIAESGFQP